MTLPSWAVRMREGLTHRQNVSKRVVVMSSVGPIQVLVLQEFRLLAADADGAVSRIVAASPGGVEPHVPLMTSIDDRRDVATLRVLHAGEPAEPNAAQRAALDPLVS